MLSNRSILFLVIGALIMAVGVLGYNLYDDRKQTGRLEIKVGPNGLKIQGR
jgi:NADH:ubiquinone oxidoreductase subunit H